MLKYILAAATALTVANSAQSATLMAFGHMNGVEVSKTDLLPLPGAKCAIAASTFSRGMETQLGYHRVPLTFARTDEKGIKYYLAKTSNGVDLMILCLEDGVML